MKSSSCSYVEQFCPEKIVLVDCGAGERLKEIIIKCNSENSTTQRKYYIERAGKNGYRMIKK